MKTNQVQKGPAREKETTAKGKRQKAGVLFLKGEGEGEDVGFNFFFFSSSPPRLKLERTGRRGPRVLTCKLP